LVWKRQDRLGHDAPRDPDVDENRSGLHWPGAVRLYPPPRWQHGYLLRAQQVSRNRQGGTAVSSGRPAGIVGCAVGQDAGNGLPRGLGSLRNRTATAAERIDIRAVPAADETVLRAAERSRGKRLSSHRWRMADRLRAESRSPRIPDTTRLDFVDE